MYMFVFIDSLIDNLCFVFALDAGQWGVALVMICECIARNAYLGGGLARDKGGLSRGGLRDKGVLSRETGGQYKGGLPRVAWGQYKGGCKRFQWGCLQGGL